MASKIIYVLVAMAVLNLALLIFSCSAWDPETGECAGRLTSDDNSTIWNLMSNPTTVGDNFGKPCLVVGGGYWQQ